MDWILESKVTRECFEEMMTKSWAYRAAELERMKKEAKERATCESQPPPTVGRDNHGRWRD